jgi:hypothetical protein
MPQKLFDLVQSYAKQKFLVTPTIGGGKVEKKRKILDAGSLEESAHKTIFNDLYT